MEDCTINDWTFTFEDPQPVLDTEEFNMGHPYLSGPGRWENYSDDQLYNAECLLRQFLETKRGGWGTPNQSARKFTAKMMYEILYNEPAPKTTTAIVVKLNRLLNHYATRVYRRKNTTIRGERVRGKVYLLSAQRLDKPPYSLRLRLEWMAERGILPTWSNMQLSGQLKEGETRTSKNARYRAREVKHVRREKRARNDELYGTPGEV